jgi:hypothetical protein
LDCQRSFKDSFGRIRADPDPVASGFPGGGGLFPFFGLGMKDGLRCVCLTLPQPEPSDASGGDIWNKKKGRATDGLLLAFT